MNDTYLDLAARLEDSFPDMENEIILDLRENNEDYAALRGKISDIENKHRFIGQVLNGSGEVHLTAKEQNGGGDSRFSGAGAGIAKVRRFYGK